MTNALTCCRKKAAVLFRVPLSLTKIEMVSSSGAGSRIRRRRRSEERERERRREKGSFLQFILLLP